MPFQPGQSGNPSGRPKVAAVVKELAREHTEAAIAVLVAALADDDGRTRIAAANSLLDRGYGKPTQPLAGDDDLPDMQVQAKIVVEYVAASSGLPVPAPAKS